MQGTDLASKETNWKMHADSKPIQNSIYIFACGEKCGLSRTCTSKFCQIDTVWIRGKTGPEAHESKRDQRHNSGVYFE
jgi:hypothetical protein